MRDHSLDLLKGLACILMIFAHSTGIENSPLTSIFAGDHNMLVRAIYLAGETAPIFFFAVSGITAYLQGQKYNARSVFASCFMLFVLGFSYNGITQRDFYGNFRIEIVQIIAIGVLLVYIVQRLIQPASVVFLIIGLGSYALKVSSDHIDWLWSILTAPKGVLLAPGSFPVLLWLFLFFLGAFAYTTKNRNNLISAVAAIAVFAVLKLYSIQLQPLDKWNMSVGYFLLSCCLLFSSIYVVRRIAFFKQRKGKEVVLFLGEFSLLFLFVHKFVIRVLQRLAVAYAPVYSLLSNPLVFWCLVFVVTVIIMRIILRYSDTSFVNRLFKDVRVWLGLACLIMVIPLLTKDGVVIYGLELTLGTVFAVHYPKLRMIVNQMTLGGLTGAYGNGAQWFPGHPQVDD